MVIDFCEFLLFDATHVPLFRGFLLVYYKIDIFFIQTNNLIQSTYFWDAKWFSILFQWTLAVILF